MYKYRRIFIHTVFLLVTFIQVRADSSSVLPDAMEAKNFPEALQLIDAGSDVNVSQPDGTTALIWASYYTKADIVKTLLEHGANPTAENRYGARSISIACLNGDLTTVRLLLDAGADANRVGPDGRTLLMTAAQSGNPELVQLLISQNVAIDDSTESGQTALMWAANEGHADVVKVLLDAGANPNLVTKLGFTPIHFAARGGYSEAVAHLLQAGVDVNLAIDWKGGKGHHDPIPNSTPLILAMENGYFEVATQLLEAGANPNDDRSGFAALHMMTWVRKAGIAEAENPEPPSFRTAMSSTEFLIKLIEHGADLNQLRKPGKKSPENLSNQGITPFYLAAVRGDYEMMKLLVEQGADPHITDKHGTTALMVAAGIGRGANNDEAGTEDEAMRAVQYCLELGMDINTVNDNGETVMHGAAYGQWANMVTFLYENGADIKVWNKRNKHKWSPLLIAQGYRSGNFKPSFETIAAIEAILAKEGVTERFALNE